MKHLAGILSVLFIIFAHTVRADEVWRSVFVDQTWPTAMEACEQGEAQARVDAYTASPGGQYRYQPVPPGLNFVTENEAVCDFAIEKFSFIWVTYELVSQLLQSEPAPCASGIVDENGLCIDLDLAVNQGDPGDCNGSGGPSRGVGNPINFTTGNKYQYDRDFSIPALPGSVSLARAYNGLLPGKGIFGEGWTSLWEQAVFVDVGETKAVVRRADGRGDIFDYSGGAWVNTQNAATALVRAVDDSWTYTDEDDREHNFDSQGRLASILDRSGRLSTLEYVTGQLDSVTDSYGNTLAFAFNNGLVESVTTPGGVYGFSYDASGNLVEVIYPDNTPETDTDNPRRIFHYEDTNFPNALTGITDTNEDRYATWSYDSQGRATSSAHNGGTDLHTIDYTYLDDATDSRTTVTNALGKQTTYHFTTILGVRKVTQVEGHQSTNCAAANKAYTYDTHGFLASKTDWQGNTTTYTRNTRGQELSRIEAVGTPDERTITTEWHPTFNLPTKITEPGRETVISYDANGNELSRTITETAP